MYICTGCDHMYLSVSKVLRSSVIVYRMPPPPSVSQAAVIA